MFRFDRSFRDEFRSNGVYLAIAFVALTFGFAAPAFSLPFIYPEVIREFGWTREQATLLASAKYLTGAVACVVFGRVMDVSNAWNGLIVSVAVGGVALGGFLLVDGLLSREVDVMGRRCCELLGQGDVMRPWNWDDEGSHVKAEVGWQVLEPTRLAVLDQAAVARAAPWPQLGVELFSRGIRRAHGLAVSLAIAHHQRVDERLLLTLWHLAERWGRVIPGGIAVPLPLSHQRLADLIGAHRPSVTTAMGELARDERVSRRDDGDWVLHGAPPEQVRHHRLLAAMT